MLTTPFSSYFFFKHKSLFSNKINSYQLQAALNSGYTTDCNNVVIEKLIMSTVLGI